MMTAEERAEWLARRRTGLGATDVACVLGVGFRTPAEVYAEKVGDAPDRDPNPLMALGLATEDHNAALYTKRTGLPLISPGLISAQSEPWAFATFDRVATDRGALLGRPVELKYTTFFDPDKWGPDGTDQVRDGYLVQAVWQAAILRDRGHAIDRTDVSVLAGTGEHRVYHVPFDERLAALLFEAGRSFWARVETRAGAADWEAPLALVDAIADRLAAIRPDTSVQLDDLAAAHVDAYEHFRGLEKNAREKAEEHKAELCKLLGTNETGVLPDGRRVQQKATARAGYTVEASTYVRFSILKPKKGKLS